MSLLEPYPATDAVRPVSSLVNSVQNDGPELLIYEAEAPCSEPGSCQFGRESRCVRRKTLPAISAQLGRSSTAVADRYLRGFSDRARRGVRDRRRLA